jgi:hypothetical protein
MNLRRTAATVAASALLGFGVVAATAAPAAADYGSGNIYQIEISSNVAGPDGFGVWVWFALSPSAGSTTSGTGDYAGSDCGHGFGAVADLGEVTWSVSGGTLTITGFVLNGFNGLPVTITVPAAYGHYSTDVASVFQGAPPGGFSEVQVAP